MNKPFHNNYNDAFQYLNALVDCSKIPNLTFSEEKFDLQRLRDLLALMGNPHQGLRVIHIAGTKGKGSTAAMLEAVLRAAGYRTGLFTSPFLVDFREQIQIDRTLIPQEAITRLIENMRPLLDRVKGITVFEATTVMAFQYFFEQKVDLAVVEAGLGGRTDATNVVDPLLSVITPISFDHIKMLGSTSESIAGHKAGILKPGRPAVLAAQVYPQAVHTVQERAKELGCALIEVDKSILTREISHSLDGQRFYIEFNSSTVPHAWDGEYDLNLLGSHQVGNAATAMAALQILDSLGFPISRQHIETGLRHISWPCRFEILRREPLTVLDGAHNVDSMSKLRQAVDDYLPEKKIILVFNAFLDKDIEGMLKILRGRIEYAIFPQNPHPRAENPAKLVELGQSYGICGESADSISSAIARAGILAEDRTAILITGSLSLAAAARQNFLKEQE